MAEIPLPYNGILGRPAVNSWRHPLRLQRPQDAGCWGVLSVKADRKDAVFCVEQMWRAAAAATPGNTDVAGPSDPSPPRKKLLAGDGALTKQVPLRDGV